MGEELGGRAGLKQDAADGRTEDHPQVKPEEYFWLRRQAEKLEKELASRKEAQQAEIQQMRRELEETRRQSQEAEWRASRLAALAEAELPKELAQLVPEGDPETVKGYVDKLKPLAERLQGPVGRGTNTNPANSTGAGQLHHLAFQAAKGDREALRRYAHLREQMRAQGQLELKL